MSKVNANIEKQIEKGSAAGHKTYRFDESHDSRKPAQMWFQQSTDGLTLFIVFYTQACRWSRCLGCNLPSKSSRFHVSYRDIIAQVDYIFNSHEVLQKRSDIQKLIVSNNGSILDEATFSSTALMYLMAMVNLNLPNLAVLTLETRPEYVDIEELEFLSRTLAEGDTPTALELGIGFESFDEKIRNEIFNKGLSLDVFEKFIEKIAPYKYRVKCYFMQKPVPDFSDEAALTDVKDAIDYLDSIAAKYEVAINMHLNPTYAAYGTELETSFLAGIFAPPKLQDVAKAVYHGRTKKLSIFVGLYDEGLAVEGGSFIRSGDGPLIDALEIFNRSQSYQLLEKFIVE